MILYVQNLWSSQAHAYMLHNLSLTTVSGSTWQQKQNSLDWFGHCQDCFGREVSQEKKRKGERERMEHSEKHIVAGFVWSWRYFSHVVKSCFDDWVGVCELWSANHSTFQKSCMSGAIIHISPNTVKKSTVSEFELNLLGQLQNHIKTTTVHIWWCNLV